jgi:hypothetical protein
LWGRKREVKGLRVLSEGKRRRGRIEVEERYYESECLQYQPWKTVTDRVSEKREYC